MEIYNPWWKGEYDETYLEWKGRGLKWKPSVLDHIPKEPFSLNFLTGPRQVGKTTAVKILIQEAIKKKRSPYSIFYFPCDEILNFDELGEILDTYISARDARNIKSSLIVLDEIQFTKNWWRALKSRIDTGIFKNDILIITGSSSIDLLKEKERFPGRRGNGKDLVLYPLNFSEYVQLFSEGIESKKFENMKSPELDKIILPNKFLKSDINKLFRKYLITGGFPTPIHDYHSNGIIRRSTKKSYLDWILGDIRRMDKNDIYMKEVLTYLLQTKTSPISWLSIAKNTSINSSHTAQSYVELLRDIYLVSISHYIDPNGRIHYRKNKKIHFFDPFLIKILTEYTRTEMLEEHIVESLISGHFSRKYDSYYWRGSTEVDIITQIDSEIYGFEVKWGPTDWKKPRFLRKSYLLTKEVIPSFLASLDWNGGQL